MDQSEKVLAARQRLADKFGDNVKLGGKGSQRRKNKVVHKTNINSDSKLKTVMKRVQAQPLPDVGEVNMFMSDNSVVQFKKPEVHGSIQNQTMFVFGNPETRELKDVFTEIMQQMGPKQIETLKNMKLGDMKPTAPINEEAEAEDEEEAPKLVDMNKVD